MATPNTQSAVRRAAAAQDLKPDALATAMSNARAATRAAILEATALQFDLAEVTDTAERQQGVEELSQKVGGLIREAGKLRDQMERVRRIAEEIERETPRIAGQLGISLGGQG